MAKPKTVYTCSECGHETSKWSGRCPECSSYNTLNEEMPRPEPRNTAALELGEISAMPESRISTGIPELDRVTGGGFVDSSLTLVGGEPGIGKSTLLLQFCSNAAKQGKKALYVSGEESARQIKLRADRLKIQTSGLFLLAETSFETIERSVRSILPNFLIIDSIQTMRMGCISSSPGSVTQVRECASAVMRLTKSDGITAILIGHVTKEGALAGPRILEHMVDSVLYFEGERRADYRLIRAVKNRFGATGEIGVFEMRESGLVGITNPSEFMLSGRPLGVSGSVVTCGIEGSRPILAEIQALAASTSFSVPRRVVSGLDFNRSAMLVAVLEKRAGLRFGQYDVYMNVAGGMKIDEPSVDAAIVAACASSYKNAPIPEDMLIVGEVGLAGELRAVGGAEQRLAEAARMGFRQCVLPKANARGIKKPDNFRLFGAAGILEMLAAIE